MSSTAVNPTTTNGVTAPTRLAPPGGSPHKAAIQSNSASTAKLASLNKAAHSGGATGGATQEVAVIKPMYTNTFQGNQSVTGQQVGNATTANKAYVQSQGDKVPLVQPKTGGRRRRRSTRRRKRKSTKRGRRRSNRRRS